MSIEINVYGDTRISADARHHDGAHWATIHFTGRDGKFAVCSFFATAELADTYAAAINGVQVAQPAESEAA
jgi:hypothetical protein